VGSDIDDLFNEIMKWDVSTIESIWYYEHKIGSYVAMTHDQGDYKKKKKTQYDKILKCMESNSNFVDEAKLIILKYFLFDENNKRGSMEEQSEKVIYQVNELLVPDDVSNSSDESKGREISKMQLFAALDMRDNGYEIVKVTWKNVTSAWGPKVIFKDANHYYHLFEKQADFGALVERYKIAAGLGSAQFIPEYSSEEILGGLFVRMKTPETSNCKTLDLRFREAEEEERKALFTGVMRAYFRDDATIKEITEEEKFGHTFPRLEDGDLETIRSSMGTRILLSTVEVKRKQHHIVHGDEWGGNFLVKKNNDVYFIDFEDALYCQKETDKIETVGGDLSSRIFYKKKESKDVEKRFSLYGLGICGSLGRLLAALIQYECRPNGNLKGRFRDDEIKPTITCFLDSFNEAPGHDGLEREDLLMYRNQILAYAWDWGIYWNEKNMWRSGTFDKFEKIIKELLEEKDEASILTHPRSAGTARDGDVNQNQSGNDNVQISISGDAVIAIGPGATAAGRDISVSIQDEPTRSSLREGSTGPGGEMPSDNTEGRDEKTIEDRNIERADDDAWDWYVKGDMGAAEEGWRDALQMLNDSKSIEDRGYFTYWMTRASYLNNQDVPSALKSMLQCIELCKAEEDDKWLMEALLFLAYLRRMAKDIGQARHIIDQIVSLYHKEELEENPDPFDVEQLLEWSQVERKYSIFVLSQIKRQVANFLRVVGELPAAASLYGNLMRFHTGLEHNDDADNARMILGILKSDLGEYEESDTLENQCLNYRRKEYAKLNDGDTREITKALRNLGQNAIAWKKYAKAKQYFTDCIVELRKVPSEIIPEDDLKYFISFNQSLMEKCDLLAEIRRIQIHERDDNRVNLLIEAMEGSDSHKHLYVVPILSAKMDRRRALDFSKSLDEKDYTAKLNLKIAKLLYNKFLHADEAKRFLNSITIDDLDQKLKIEVLLMYETVFFFESHDKDELIRYHSILQQEYSVEYPNILIEIDYKWDDELEQQNLCSLFSDLVGLDKDEQRWAINEFFESEPSRIARHLFVRIVVDCMKGGGEYRDKLLQGSVILSSSAITKLCLNNLIYISRYYTDSYNDVHDFLYLAGFSGISYANENRANRVKLERLQYKLSKLNDLYQTRWLGDAEREICNDIFSFITEGLLGNKRKKFDAWDSILQKIIDLSNMTSRRYLSSLLHSVMIWDERMYRGGFLLKSTVRMKELADILVKWIHSEPNLFSLSTVDYRKKSARWFLEKANVPEHEWDLSIRTDFEDNLD
jgi:hypothetical protein